MRKKGTNPIAVIMLAAAVIIGLAVACVVKTHMAQSSWSGIIFWLVFIGISGTGSFLIGKYINKGGR